MEQTYAFEGVGVKIMGRLELEALAREGFAPGTFVISITDTDAPPVRLDSRPAGVLRLVFDDVGNADFPISCHVMEDADEEDLAVIEMISNPITPAQGAQVAEFVRANLPQMEYLICQCEMGQSRSAAVAAAVMDAFTGLPCGIFKDKRYGPNSLVYHTVLEALNAREPSK